jgi:Ribonuclease HII
MTITAGVDEVGRGPLAGPVVAAAVILPEDHTIDGLRDSKKLSKLKREFLFPLNKKRALGVGLGKVAKKTIDKINIRKATFKAMQIA